MSVPTSFHCVLESSVYDAFPVQTPPLLVWQDKWTIQFEAKKLLTGKTWPEVIGFRLIDGELDPSLSIWMEALPLEVFHYYLPSHLILSAILLQHSPISLMYPMCVMEALILPPSMDPEVLRELDDELYTEAFVSNYAELRLKLYKMMTKAQRACVAQYLSLYLEYKKAEYTERGLELYIQNRDIWAHSLLPD